MPVEKQHQDEKSSPVRGRAVKVEIRDFVLDLQIDESPNSRVVLRLSIAENIVRSAKLNIFDDNDHPIGVGVDIPLDFPLGLLGQLVETLIQYAEGK